MVTSMPHIGSGLAGGAEVKRDQYNNVEQILIPEPVADLARRRCRTFLRAAIHSINVLDVLMVDCYLQGLSDGAAVAETRGGLDVPAAV